MVHGGISKRLNWYPVSWVGVVFFYCQFTSTQLHGHHDMR